MLVTYYEYINNLAEVPFLRVYLLFSAFALSGQTFARLRRAKDYGMMANALCAFAIIP